MGRALLGNARMSGDLPDDPETPRISEDRPMRDDNTTDSTSVAPEDASRENIVHFNPWRDFNDAVSQVDVFGDEPDPAQIAQFMG
jgi:hypothetical protein